MNAMEAVLVVGAAMAMLWLIDRAGIALSNGAVRVLVRGFVVWLGGRLDPWPPGVQEEDRDHPWGHGSETTELSVSTLRVRSSVRRH